MIIDNVPPSAYVRVEANFPLRQQLSTTIEKIMRMNSHIILGTPWLFDHDPEKQTLTLSPPFGKLLRRLVDLQELPPAVLEASTILDLNTFLQKPQGSQGGFMRPPGQERWDLSDNPTKQTHQKQLEELFVQIGFVPIHLTEPMKVDHCIVFGARVERMSSRIRETVEYIKNNLTVSGNVFLLGSKRALVPDEKSFLQSIVAKLEEPEKQYWNEFLEKPDELTEANAFILLWKAIVPQELQNAFKDRVVGINSTRIGPSYNDDQGHRPTTDVTVTDWRSYYKEGEPQAIFALTNQPFMRLADQLRRTVVLNAPKDQKIDFEKLVMRNESTTFYFPIVQSEPRPLVSVFLDEIARTVYEIKGIVEREE